MLICTTSLMRLKEADSETAGINVQKDTDGDPILGQGPAHGAPVRAIFSIICPE
jgi:hypothetical protein